MPLIELREVGKRHQFERCGITAADLKSAGLSAFDMHKADYDCDDIKEVGYTFEECSSGHYSADDLVSASFPASDFRGYDCSQYLLKYADFDVSDLCAGGQIAAECKLVGCSRLECVVAGFSTEELIEAKFTATSSLPQRPPLIPNLSDLNPSLPPPNLKKSFACFPFPSRVTH